jgi:hypothetical protein
MAAQYARGSHAVGAFVVRVDGRESGSANATKGGFGHEQGPDE